MKLQDIQTLQSLPASDTCRRIDFDSFDVVPGFVPNTFILIVTGKKPWSTMNVQLSPLVYIDRPDYWGIEVIGCQSGIGLPVTAPYTVALDISGVIGTKGIEVIGASRSEKRAVP